MLYSLFRWLLVREPVARSATLSLSMILPMTLKDQPIGKNSHAKAGA